jgi:hypothetical protein
VLVEGVRIGTAVNERTRCSSSMAATHRPFTARAPPLGEHDFYRAHHTWPCVARGWTHGPQRFFFTPRCRRFRLSPNLHHPPLHLHPCTSNPAYLHGYIQRYGIMMMELAFALAVGFALGYGVREWVSRQRRRAFGRQRR